MWPQPKNQRLIWETLAPPGKRAVQHMSVISAQSPHYVTLGVAELDTKCPLRFQDSLLGWGNMSMSSFLKNPIRGETFFGHDLLIDTPVLTLVLQAVSFFFLTRTWKLGQASQERQLLSAWLPTGCCLKASVPEDMSLPLSRYLTPRHQRQGHKHKSLFFSSLNRRLSSATADLTERGTFLLKLLFGLLMAARKVGSS